MNKQAYINIVGGVIIIVIGALFIAGIGFCGKLYLAIDGLARVQRTVEKDNTTHHRRLSKMACDIKEAWELAIRVDERSKCSE